MSDYKPISFDDLDLSKDDMEKIAAGARAFLAPEEPDEFDLGPTESDEEAHVFPEPPELEEAPSDLVTRRNLRE